jgi:hypothetical protein
MTQTLESLLQPAGPPATPFDPSSRYYGIATTTMTVAGRPVVYVQRRFVPQPDVAAVYPAVTFRKGLDRLDRLASKYLGDAELFWQLCDANRVLDPAELEVPNRVIRLPLAVAFLGVTNG